MLIGHGGNIYAAARQMNCTPADIIDMSSNINPLGPMPGLQSHLKQHIGVIAALPPVDGAEAVSAFAKAQGIEPTRVLLGNGTTQFIYSLPLALNVRKALIVGPTYRDYADACAMHSRPFDYLLCKPESDFSPDLDRISDAANRVNTVFICNPNNPTGALVPADDIIALCTSHPDTFFVIDESYLPFVAGKSGRGVLHADLDNLIVLHSLSKIFRIPGMRIGFLIASVAVAKRFAHYALPWNCSSLAQKAIEFLMDPENNFHAFVKKSQDLVVAEKTFFHCFLGPFPNVRALPGAACYFLVKLHGNLKADRLCRQMLQHRILLRNCENFEGLSNQYIRISLKTRKINALVAEKMSTYIA